MEITSKPIANRYDFVYLFDVTGSNLNGDPDAGNQPRIDPETGHGLVTDVCLKRKIRNFVTISQRNGDGPVPGYDIYVKEGSILANEQRKAYVAGNGRLKASDRPNDDARNWMCQTFYDVRTFGAVMTTGKIEGEDKTKFKEYIDPKAKRPLWNCMKGHMLHERADEEASELRGDVWIERAMPLWSRRLGLVGRADVVEFHGQQPFPIEYKAGPRRQWGHDDLQLCAQALCLEEMMAQTVRRGAMYHHGARRRRDVVFDDALRQRVVEAVADIREMLAAGILPPAVNDARCKHCSLVDSCLPSVIGQAGRVRALQASLFRVSESRA